MRILKTILSLVLIGLIGYAIWASPSAQEQLGLLIGTVRLNSAVFAIICIPIIVVILAALLAAWSNSRQPSRKSDQNAPVVAHNAIQPTILKPAARKKPKLSIITGGKKSSAPNNIVVEKASDTVFFQPILRLPKYRVVGYDVYRQVFSSGNKARRFSQTLRGGTERNRAEFEYSTIERAIEATPRIPGSGTRIYLPVGIALLSDTVFWPKLHTLLEAHQAAAKRFCVVIAASAFLDPAIKQHIKDIAALKFSCGISLEHTDVDLLESNVLPQFNVVAVDYNLFESIEDQAMSGGSKDNRFLNKILCRKIVAEANLVDALAMDITLMAGDYFSTPRALKSDIAQAS